MAGTPTGKDIATTLKEAAARAAAVRKASAEAAKSAYQQPAGPAQEQGAKT